MTAALKRRFDPTQGLFQMVDSMLDELHARRAGRRTTADREVDWALKMPGILISAGMGLLPHKLSAYQLHIATTY